MPNDAKSVTVNVILRTDDPLAFDVDSNDLEKDKDGNLIFENNGHPGFMIHFDLDDQTGKGYVFPQNSKKDDAIFSKLGDSGCPASGQEVFRPITVKPHRQTLIVHNPNEKPALGKFRYTLQVGLRGASKYLPLDPGGVNQNGPTQPFSKAALLLTGAVVGALLTLGAEALLR
jgi:hypothetical protein